MHAPRHRASVHTTHTQVGLRHFEVLPSTFEETLDKGAFPTGAAYAVATARAKAAQVAAGVRAGDSTRQAFILAADTVVEAADGSILEKPDGEGDAARMLAFLAGTTHAVHTGVSLVVLPAAVPAGDGGEEATTAPRATFVEFSETTAVTFAPLSAAEIDAYVATGEGDGKAGAYGIQGAAGAWVSRLEGCYFNVVGLPLHAVGREVAALVAAGVLV
jgi:septum formation protein